MAGIALLPKVLPRYGKRNLICAGCILGVAGQLLFLMNITSVSLGVVTCIMRGIGIAPFYGVQYSLPSDAIEYGQWKTGKRVEGLMFSSMSMGQKAGSGLTSAIMGGILSAAYFDGTKATAAEQSAEAIRVIKGFYLYVPIAIWVVMFGIAACYQLDKVYDRMMRELIQREAGEKTASVQGEIQSMPLPEASGNRINVAIGRLYGSSGRKIAEDVAKALDCKVYDRQIICLMAEKFGMEKADLESVRQYLDSYNYEDSELTFSPYGHSSAGAAADYTGVQMFEVQSRIIRELSERRQVYSWEDVPTMCFVESHMHTAFSFMQMMLTGKKRARNIIKASLLENWRNVIRSEMNTMRSLPESAETIPIITIW